MLSDATALPVVMTVENEDAPLLLAKLVYGAVAVKSILTVGGMQNKLAPLHPAHTGFEHVVQLSNAAFLL